ncbi:cyclin-K [Ophiostoma piceae UAMH 11346]|uniref:RNA polymerase II holoenzyme cyclin-like subunit n=1 Tax=Ophiostoma piceae (strain UAMH 11346) TaxID=1262450 RepID=S3CEY3_OPHP1|nr:cyclin-K [Ophiostoma piceae UAMH 11346]
MASIDRFRPAREGYQPPTVRQGQAPGQAPPAGGAPGSAAVPPPSAIPERMSQSVSPSRRNANAHVPPAVPSPPVSSRTSPPAHSHAQRHPHPPSQLGKPPIRADASTPTRLPPPPPAPTAPPPGQPPFASQWYYTEEELASTPSVLHGITPADERERRAKGVNFIYQAGIAVQPQPLPQVTLFVAAVFFHRFYMRYSCVEERGGVHHYNIAATALFLANKTEENCFKTKHLIVAVAKVAQKNMNLIVDEQSKEYWRWRDSILTYEELMLEILTFDLNVTNPYDQLWQQLRALGQLGCKPVREAAWSFLNDAGLTQLPLQLDARDLAAASIFFASVVSNEKLEDVQGQRWWQHVRGDEARMVRATLVIIEFYNENPLKRQHTGIRAAATSSSMAEASAGSASPAYHLELTRRPPVDLAAGMYDGSTGSVSRDVTPMELDRQSQSQSQTQTQTQTQTLTQAASVVATAPGGSDAALKAVANNLDNGLHPVDGAQQNGSGSAARENGNSNGKREMEEGEYVSSPPAAKRPRTVSYEERERSRERSRDRNGDRGRDHARRQDRSPSRSRSRDGSRSLSYGS